MNPPVDVSEMRKAEGDLYELASAPAPANGFANLWPSRITFARGGIITGIIGIVIMPWRLLENADRYIGWLIAYSGFLGPVAGIFIRRDELAEGAAK